MWASRETGICVCACNMFTHTHVSAHSSESWGGQCETASNGWFHSPWVLLPESESSLLSSAARVLKGKGSLKTAMLCEWRCRFYRKFRLSLRKKESSEHLTRRAVHRPGSPIWNKSYQTGPKSVLCLKPNSDYGVLTLGPEPRPSYPLPQKVYLSFCPKVR